MRQHPIRHRLLRPRSQHQQLPPRLNRPTRLLRKSRRSNPIQLKPRYPNRLTRRNRNLLRRPKSQHQPTHRNPNPRIRRFRRRRRQSRQRTLQSQRIHQYLRPTRRNPKRHRRQRRRHLPFTPPKNLPQHPFPQRPRQSLQPTPLYRRTHPSQPTRPNQRPPILRYHLRPLSPLNPRRPSHPFQNPRLFQPDHRHRISFFPPSRRMVTTPYLNSKTNNPSSSSSIGPSGEVSAASS